MKRALFFILLVAIFSGCATNRFPPEYPDERRGPYPEEDRYPYPDERRGPRSDKGKHKGDERMYPFSALRIPRGHLPPPGECKIWIPGVPPGHQGPPQSCASALRNAPLGAWVITHDGTRYMMRIFSPRQRSVVEEVRYYLLGE